MPASALDYAVQPYDGTDVVAFVLLVAAIHCLAIRWRDGERGMGWFGVSMGTLAVWVAANRLHLPSGPELNPSLWYLVMCVAQGAMAPGLVAYLGIPPPGRRLTLGLILLPSLVFAALVIWVVLSGATVLRLWAHLMTALAFATMGATALWAARREPGAGHAWLGAALLTVPALAAMLIVTRADPVAIRYWAIFPAMLVGMTLPTISVMRRQRALRAEVARRAAAEHALARTNDSLELAVAERTADLQSMVAGLQSFNRSISHDLRGPLGGIAGLARLADEALAHGDDSVARRVLPSIATQADTSTRLVATLLELARVGDVALKRQNVDATLVAKGVVEQLRIEAQGKRLPDFRVQPLPEVDADPDLLRAVLANLIGNAVKFSSDRADALVEISAKADQSGVCFQVRDNGVGFDAGAASALFAPFRRLHAEQYEGHGIGLSIVRRAVERHGGKVWADATLGQGACFSFTLPKSA